MYRNNAIAGSLFSIADLTDLTGPAGPIELNIETPFF
jgi:hypothetical protein